VPALDCFFFKYYSNSKNLKIFVNLVEGNTFYSKRILEFFVTNYAYKYNISYKVKNKDFYVHHGYKDQLKSYSKKSFDIFRRENDISSKFNLV
jgi:hypothetical protein